MVKHQLSDTTKNSKAGEMLSDILLPIIYNCLIYNAIPPLKEVIEVDNGKDMLVRLRIIVHLIYRKDTKKNAHKMKKIQQKKARLPPKYA